MPGTNTQTVDNLDADNLCCVRGDNTLFSAISFRVSGGQCLHVIGVNGSGKTSLLRILCGLNQADQGKVLWNQLTVSTSADYRAASAYVGHKDALKNELTAIENLRFYQQLNGGRDEDALDQCLHSMGLLQCTDLPTQFLSFGQRRRLAFARLLTHHYKVWILDEPFTGIDTEGRRLIEQMCVSHLQGDGLIVMTHHQSLESSALNNYRTELRLG
jgi:heme exporter protein A